MCGIRYVSLEQDSVIGGKLKVLKSDTHLLQMADARTARHTIQPAHVDVRGAPQRRNKHEAVFRLRLHRLDVLHVVTSVPLPEIAVLGEFGDEIGKGSVGVPKVTMRHVEGLGGVDSAAGVGAHT